MENEKQQTVSVFSYEGVLAALERSNKRLLIALISTCITLILVSAILIFGNAVNNRVWMQYVHQVTEAGETNARVHEQPNP